MKLTLHGLPHEENKRARRGACEVTPEQPFHPKPTGGPDMTTRNIAYSPIASNIASAGLTLAVLVAFAALLPLVVPGPWLRRYRPIWSSALTCCTMPRRRN